VYVVFAWSATAIEFQAVEQFFMVSAVAAVAISPNATVTVMSVRMEVSPVCAGRSAQSHKVYPNQAHVNGIAGGHFCSFGKLS
jgi:hypothetical protein